MKTTPFWRLTLSAVFLSLSAVCFPVLADIQYWNPTTTAKGAGSNDWDTAVGAWANTTAGTNAPVPWSNGNDANFTLNNVVNHASINGVSARHLYFQDGTFTFWPGTGSLSLAGSLTNINNLLTINADVTLTADQNWEIRKTTTVSGTLVGPYTLMKTGSASLILSNANNNIAGLFLDSHYVQAYGGGNTVGGPGATLTMGSPSQTTISKLELYPLGNQSETAWAIGPVTANGFGEIGFKSTSDAVTNRVGFGNLSRTNRGVLSLRQEASAFNIRQAVTFSNANEIVVNGMLPPWVATQASGDFLSYDGVVKNVSYKATAPDTWTATDVVHNSATRTLTADAAVYALRASADLTIPEGITLTNASGGIILVGRAIRGDGSLQTEANDLIVYATGTSAIYPSIAANGLTVWGGGTLIVSNITWSGDTYIQQGTLNVVVSEDTVLQARNILGGYGSFTKDGPQDLTLLNSTGKVGKITVSGYGALSLSNSRYQTLTGIAFGSSNVTLNVVNGSYLGCLGTTTTGTGNTNVSINLIGTGVAGSSTVLDCGQFGLYIGVDNGYGNTALIDGQGVTGGACVTNIQNSGNVGFAVGRGPAASNNCVVIANGGEVWDYEADNNRNNGVGVGTGANNNRLEILGGNGFVSTLFKSYPHSIGSGAATGNSALIDGKGFPGSAVFRVGNGTGLNIGSGRGGFGNSMVITNGGKFIGGSIIVGANADGNRLDVVGDGSEVVGNGGDTTFSLGTNIASNNVFYVADGGMIRNIGKWSTCIGGSGNATSGNAVGNRMIIGANGTFLTPNTPYIGYNKDAGSTAISNSVQVTGAGAYWSFGGSSLKIGVEQAGSVAQGNALNVDHGGLVVGGAVYVGSMTDATAGGASTGNRMTITSGGLVRLSSKAVSGSISGAASSSGNRIELSSGGILEANTLEIGAANDNTISCSDRGVYQFTSTTPTITSLTPGDISINGGVIAFRGITSANVRGNFSGTQLTNMTWSGSNVFRLTDASTTTGLTQDYLFELGLGATNYVGLEMVDGTTRYRGISGNTLTIGQTPGSSASMLCSNTTASVEMPFTLNGDLTLFNSTLTLQQDAEINGDLFIDLNHLAGPGPALIADGALTLGASSTLHLAGTPTNGMTLVTYTGTRIGNFTVQGLPRDYSVKYDTEAPGTISILYAPVKTLIIFQ